MSFPTMEIHDELIETNSIAKNDGDPFQDYSLDHGSSSHTNIITTTTNTTTTITNPTNNNRRRHKKTTLACQPCQRSHYPCDEGRPCRSCLRRGKPDYCIDGHKKRAKYLNQLQQQQHLESNPDGPALKLLAGTATNLAMGPTLGFSHTGTTHGTLGETIHSTITFNSNSGADLSSLSTATGAKNTIDVLSFVDPYNYGPSYHRVLEMLQRRISPEGMRRICQAFTIFRPSLIAHLRELSDIDLRLMERCFTRTLLDLRRILSLTGAPHVLWRRTGEVCYVSGEFTRLTGWSQLTLGDGRRTIFEVMDEKGVIRYWEQYAGCVLERNIGTFSVGGGVIKPDGRTMAGVWWITVRRDIFDIPLMIVSCFLPDLWHSIPPLITSPNEGSEILHADSNLLP